MPNIKANTSRASSKRADTGNMFGNRKSKMNINEKMADCKDKLYQYNIRNLERNIELCKPEFRKMQEIESLPAREPNQTPKNTKDTEPNLQHTISKHMEETPPLRKQILCTQKEKKHRMETYEQQLENLRHQQQEIASENVRLAEKLTDLEQFKVQIDEMVVNIVSLKEELTQQSQDHHETISKMEIKATNNEKRTDKLLSEVYAKYIDLMQENKSLTGQLATLTKKVQVPEQNEKPQLKKNVCNQIGPTNKCTKEISESSFKNGKTEQQMLLYAPKLKGSGTVPYEKTEDLDLQKRKMKNPKPTWPTALSKNAKIHKNMPSLKQSPLPGISPASN